jgi:hypothetical protein
MSHRIEYQWEVFRVTLPNREADERFVVAIEGGDNNLINTQTGRCARRWEVGMIGTTTQVLKQAVEAAGACEGGMLKPGGRDGTPESYIRCIRQLLERTGTATRGG